MAVHSYSEMSFEDQQRQRQGRRRRRGGVRRYGRSDDDGLAQQIQRDTDRGRAELEEARRARHERIDEQAQERSRRLADLNGDPRTGGPRAAAEPVATPGYRSGLHVTLDLSDGVEQAQAYLHPGLCAIRGQLVHVRDRQRLAQSEVDWTRGAVPFTTYYVYLTVHGEIKIDPLAPRWDREAFVLAHPVYADWAALGHLFRGLQDRVLLAVPGVDRRVEVTVGAAAWNALADYQCDAQDDQHEINAAALYLVQRNGGGVVRLTSGHYSVSAQVLLRGSQVQLEGAGRATVVQGVGAWATEDTGLAASAVVNLRAKAKDSDDDAADDGTVQQGTAASQVRDVTISYGDESVYHTGWGGTLEPPERDEAGEVVAPTELVSHLQGRFPSLVVGPLGQDQTNVGTEQVVADGQKLVLRRANGALWRENVTIEAGEGATAEPCITLTNLAGTVSATLRVTGLRVNGGLYGTALGVGRGPITGGTLGLTGRAGVGLLDASGQVIGGTLTSRGRLNVSGNADLNGNLDVAGTMRLKSLADVERAIKGLYTYLGGLWTWLDSLENKLDTHIHGYWPPGNLGRIHFTLRAAGDLPSPPVVPSP